MWGLLKRCAFACILAIAPFSISSAQTTAPGHGEPPPAASPGVLTGQEAPTTAPKIDVPGSHVTLPVSEQPQYRPKPDSPDTRRPRPDLVVGRQAPAIGPGSGGVPLKQTDAGSRPVAAAPPLGGAWTVVGPQPIVNERCCGNTPGTVVGNASGRVTSLAFAANNSNIIYSGAAGGGVWKTSNGGSTWAPLTDGQASLAIGAVATDPSGNVVYAGTGEDNGSDSQFGQGILVSSNGGSSWTVTGGSIFPGAHIGGMAVDRNNAAHAWSASDLGLYQTSNTGATWTVNTAVNSGIAAVGSGPFAVRQIIQDPQTPTTLWATLSDGCQTEYGDISLSTDGGATWHPVFDVYTASGGTVAAGRISIGVGASGVAYASFSDCNGNLLALERTTNFGTSWASLNSGAGLINYFNLSGGQSGQGTYDITVAVDPTNGNRAAFGGVTIMATTNGGASFVDVGNVYGEASAPGGFIHPDFHALISTAASTFVAGNDGGIWRTTDWGGTGAASDWVNLNATINTIQFYSGTALDTSRFLGGAQDNGSPGNMPGAPSVPSWPDYHGGDGGHTAIDPTSGSSTIYAEYPFLGIEKGSSTLNSGDPNNPYDSFSAAAPCSTGSEAACNDPSSFVAPFTMDPTNPQRILAGTNKVYQSTSGGAPGSWTAISPDVTAGNGDFLSAVVIGPSGLTNFIFTGSNNGVVAMTSNGGGSWTNITGNLPAFSNANYVFPNPWVTNVAFNPANPSVAWVTLGAIGIHHVWHTTNVGAAGGTTWSTVDGSGSTALLNMITSSVIVDPNQAGQIYVGTYYGAWACQGCGGSAPSPTWSPLGTGLPNVYVNDLTLSTDGTSLVAWSHGRGAFTLPLPSSNAAAPIVNLPSPVRAVDTRNGTGGFTGMITPGSDRCFTLGGVNGVPSNAAGVVVNLTAAGQPATGWLTLYPAGQPIPATSTLNFDPNEYAIANGALVRLGTSDQVCVDAGTAPAYAIIDVTGYLTSSGSTSLALLTNSVRPVDTRSGVGGFTGPIVPGSPVCFTLAGVMGIPSNAAGALLNVTATGYGGNGWLTVYPNGSSVPSTSTVNFDTHEWAIANNAQIEIGTSGKVCVSAGANASQAIIDVAGYVTATGLAQIPLIAPARIVDTRTGLGGVTGPIVPGSPACFTLAGVAGVPASASTVIVNVTATGYGANGWLTLYPNGQPLPATSTVNFDTHEYAIANGAIMRVGSVAKVCVGAGASASQVIIDVTGYEP
jgi:hypothetical protein